MGVDVYKFKILKPNDFPDVRTIEDIWKSDELDWFEEEENKSVQKLFDKYQEFAIELECECINYDELFKQIGYSRRDVLSEEPMFSKDVDKLNGNIIFDNRSPKSKSDIVTVFRLKGDKYVIVDIDNVKTYTEKFKGFLVKMVDMQAGGMKSEFFDAGYSACSDMLDEDAKLVIFEDEGLQKVKSLFGQDAPIQSWKLGDREFIHFA